MKKIILIGGLLLVAGIQAFAQLPSFTIGIKGGVNMSKLKTDLADEANRTGYSIGLFSRVGAAGIYVQPELYLSSRGGKFTSVESSGGTTVQDDEVKFTSLDLPVLLGTRIGIPLIGVRFMAGPVFSFIVDKEKPVSSAYNSITDFSDYKNQAIGLQLGTGVDLSKLTFDVRYEQGLTNVSKSEKYSQKSNLWHISLGFKFL
jgi:hypothetical protein